MAAPTSPRSSTWAVAGLLGLSALPLTFGALRLLQFAGVVDVMPPASSGTLQASALALHIAGAVVLALVGAVQFSAAIRSRWPVWHRRAGRLSFAAGLLVGLSALWLTACHATPTAAGVLLAGFRSAFASALLLALLLGLAAARRRDFRRHVEWMTRAYALALGAATQMIVLMLADTMLAGPRDELVRALLMGFAWSFNLAVAEWLIRRGRKAAAPRRFAAFPAVAGVGVSRGSRQG